MINLPVEYIVREKVIIDSTGKGICSVIFLRGMTGNDIDSIGNEIANAINRKEIVDEKINTAGKIIDNGINAGKEIANDVKNTITGIAKRGRGRPRKVV